MMWRTFTFQFQTWQEFDAILNRLTEQGWVPVFWREEYTRVCEQGQWKLVAHAAITARSTT